MTDHFDPADDDSEPSFGNWADRAEPRLRPDLQDLYDHSGAEAVDALVAAEQDARFVSTVPCPEWCDDRDDHPWSLPLGGPDPDADRTFEREHRAALLTLVGHHRDERITLALTAEEWSDPLQTETSRGPLVVGLYGELYGIEPGALRNLAGALSRAAGYLETLGEPVDFEQVAHAVATHQGLAEG